MILDHLLTSFTSFPLPFCKVISKQQVGSHSLYYFISKFTRKIKTIGGELRPKYEIVKRWSSITVLIGIRCPGKYRNMRMSESR